jgi:hypothetical protein
MGDVWQWFFFMLAAMLAMYTLYRILAGRQDRKRQREQFRSFFGDWD